MGKRAIAVLVSILIGVGSMGEISAKAVETTAPEAVAVEEEPESEAVDEENASEQEEEAGLEKTSDSIGQSDAGLPVEDFAAEETAQMEEGEFGDEDTDIAEPMQNDEDGAEAGETTEETADVESIDEEAMYATNEIAAEMETREVIGLAVDSHSRDEIRQFIRNNLSPSFANGYAEKPSVKIPYSAGVLSDSSREAAINALNQMRYIAGIPADVTYDADYTAMAQAAALLNAVNDSLSHYPSQPEGMDDDLYYLGRMGASSSNIAMGKDSLVDSVLLWMSDSDNNNIDRVGHRRWFLNPTMKKTGFGAVGKYSAVYAHDGSFGQSSYSRVAWPAQNMPLEYWNKRDAWSVSFGEEVAPENVQVTVTRARDGKVWAFSADAADGYFNVDNDNYGQTGCVIFRPNDITYRDGDQFDVLISGAKEADVAYTVSFFVLCDGNHSYTSGVFSDPVCTNHELTCKICEKCGYAYFDDTSAIGHSYKVTGGQNGLYTVKCDFCGEEAEASVPTDYTLFWKKPGAASASNVPPAGLGPGAILEYFIKVDAYSAQTDQHIDNLTLEVDKPEQCIIRRTGIDAGAVTFLETGVYTVTVYPTYNPEYKMTSRVTIVKPIESVTVKAEPASPQSWGTQINLEAEVEGGKWTLYYTFSVIDENGTETVIRKESSDANCSWKPDAIGTYRLRVDVRDMGDDDRVVSSDLLTYTVSPQPIMVEDNKEITAKGTLTYGQPLSELQVNNALFIGQNDGMEIEGDFVWESPDEILTAGTHEVNWTFTPYNSNYEEKNGSLSVEVKKAVPEIKSGPEAGETSYHPNLTLADITLSGGTVKGVNGDNALDGSWKWTAEETSLKVPGGTYSCTFEPADTNNYELVETQVNVGVRKAVPFIKGIEAQEITYGQLLRDSALTGSVQYSETDDFAVSGSFQWEDGSLTPAVSDSGTTSYHLFFAPDDTDNYETVAGETTLTVKKAQTPSEMPQAEVSVPYSTTALTNEILRANGVLTWSFTEESLGRALEVGEPASFTIYYTGEDQGNYETESAVVTVIRSQLDTPVLSSAAAVNGGVSIKWNAVPEAVKYRVLRKTGAGDWEELAVAASNSYIDKTVAAGKKYSYTVRCLSDDELKYVSDYNKIGKAITFAATPALSAVQNTASGIKITWKKAAGASKYRVYRKTGSGRWVKLADTTSLTYTDKSAKSGTKYTYTVRCISSDGKQDTSWYNTTGKFTVFAARPVIGSISSPKAKQLTVKWKKVTGITGCQIQYSTSSTFASGNKTVTIKSAKAVSKTIGNLKSRKKYYVRVRTFRTMSSKNYYSAWSATRNIVVK